MKGTGTRQDIQYVGIPDEPKHSVLYQNPYVHVYVATIPPGTHTLYHRHCENTLYAVLEGGFSTTMTIGDPRQNSYVFTKSFGFHWKLLREISRRLSGSAYLPKHSFFLMMNKKTPVVHQVAASQKNTKDLKFLGVEIINEGHGEKKISFDSKLVNNGFENHDFIVFKIKLKNGQHLEAPGNNSSGLILATQGSILINHVGRNESSSVDIKLENGGYHWFEHGHFPRLDNTSPPAAEALIIALK